MKPLQTSAERERWWPPSLGEPAFAGSRNGMRCAFFRQPRRLLIDREGTITTYDTGPHDINGIYQPTDVSQIRFTGNHGNVDLSSLRKVASAE
jgi:hypothetical protein